MNIKDPALRRCWIEFEVSSVRGYGVTAIDLADAIAMIQQLPDHVRPTRSTRKVIEDVDVRDLDAGHVVSNMGPPVWRGVWYPNVA